METPRLLSEYFAARSQSEGCISALTEGDVAIRIPISSWPELGTPKITSHIYFVQNSNTNPKPFARAGTDWVAHASRVLAVASPPSRTFPADCYALWSQVLREDCFGDAETNTRDACAPRRSRGRRHSGAAVGRPDADWPASAMPATGLAFGR